MPFALIALGMMILASNIVVGLFAPDPGGFAATPIEANIAHLAEMFTSPVMRTFGVLSILGGGLAYIMGYGPLFPAIGEAEPEAEPAAAQAKAQPVRKPSLSPIAKTASDRANAALGRLRSMPADTFTAEARTEYEAIRDKHLPDLRSAHSKARAAFPADSPEAATLDADLAGSLDLISDKLDELIADCGDEARTGFAVARRFVELRHPSEADPLGLPSVHMVEKGE